MYQVYEMKACIYQPMVKFLIASVCMIFLPLATAENKAIPQTILAPGYGVLEFTAPLPGTYELPVLGAAADG